MRTAALVLVILVAGCGADAAQRDVSVFPETCPDIANDAIAMMNDYLATAGPSVEAAPPMPPELDQQLLVRIRSAGCTKREFAVLMGERVDAIEGDTELAEFLRATIVLAANPEDVEVRVTSPRVKTMPSAKPIPGEAAVDRAMREPPRLKIPGPAQEPPLPLPSP